MVLATEMTSYPLPTLEAPPRLQNYDFGDRPTLEDLHNPLSTKAIRRRREQQSNEDCQVEEGPAKSTAIKFGWIRGVYIRSLLNIWGVMLFLRMGWMTGQAGIGMSCLIVAISTVITIITTLSMSAICTNGEVKGGGAYYLVSRSLGPEIGGAVGAMFSFAICIAVAMYIVGAGEAVRDILREFDTGIFSVPSDTNDIRLSGVLFLVLLLGVMFIGMDFENKTQIFLLVCLLVALMDYFVGACLVPRVEQMAQGFLGWNWKVGMNNLGPDFRNGESFFTVFSVFFPSVIGILAGANISGDLKDPSYSIPRGTLLAIATTSLSYVVIILFLGFTLVRDASGIVSELDGDRFLQCSNRPCEHGLLNYNQVMSMVSGYGPIIYVGIFAATLSSALAALVSAPRLIQALAKDKIFPHLDRLAKGYGPNDEPVIATIFCFLLCLLFVLIGELNAIAPIISNFFMATYGMINFACFHASYVKSPGFRPSFKYYNQWLSLLGAVLCIGVMFVMNWITALVTVVVAVAIYIYIQKRQPEINWGSSTQGVHFKNALTSVLKLNRVEHHVKNYRPSVLVLSGNPGSRAPLVDLAHQINKGSGLLVCGHVLPENSVSYSTRNTITDFNNKWLIQRKIKGFYTNVEAPRLSHGAYSLMQSVGLGKMRPNILMLGFPLDRTRAADYVDTLHHALDMHMGLAVLRLETGLEFAHLAETEKQVPLDILQDSEDGTVAVSVNDMAPEGEVKLPGPTCTALNQFFSKSQPRSGTIDVWWLYDDGGLTMLIPHLLRQRRAWEHCNLRVLAPSRSPEHLEVHQINMTSLLNKFRIKFSDLHIVPDTEEKPTEETEMDFQKLVAPLEDLTPEVLERHRDKTLRQLRVRELLLKHSQSAALIVMTLPLPRKQSCPPSLYVAWLDMLTKDLPPCLLVRGNQTSVLTFHS